ncbi:hypothetical protein [Rhizobium leguminosarum]|nr:hypothetical protein [Rhizobium leguminosarum]MBY5349065.1 hypothetical protein [Rhizobium leguminosarum]
MSDGARLLLDALPPADQLIADRGDDSTWFCEELGASICIAAGVIFWL